MLVDADGQAHYEPLHRDAREAAQALAKGYRLGRPWDLGPAGAGQVYASTFNVPGGEAVLIARWVSRDLPEDAVALLEDAANSVRLALEREEAEQAHQQAAALRRSHRLQRDFLSRLSHELRTPLTAIRGYADSLLAPDVVWDEDSKARFLNRIESESSRMGRLVGDLLDFSAIESGLLRLQPDWCELPLVIEAAVSCLPPEWAGAVHVRCQPGIVPVWVDHDRLEQVFVNLIENALRHNPPGTNVAVDLALEGPSTVVVRVFDDGSGIPSDLAAHIFEPQGAGAAHALLGLGWGCLSR